MNNITIISLINIFIFIFHFLFAQNITSDFSDSDIKQMIENFKKDERGPFQAIRWFCPDGSVIPAVERCADPGGIQHALLKDEVVTLAEKRHIFLGQILAGTDFETFWDKKNNHSQLKQYLLEQYLKSIDDGWILHKACYYRGAIQIEDEANWGFRFLQWLVEDSTNLQQKYFLIRQAVRTIPHNAIDPLWDRIRSDSKILSDSIPSFLNIRIKLHGQPDETDLEKIRQYRKRYTFDEKWNEKFDQLEKDLIEAYKPTTVKNLSSFLKVLPKKHALTIKLKELIYKLENNSEINPDRLEEMTSLLWDCRHNITEIDKAKTRLTVFDLSIMLETIIFSQINSWQPATLRGILDKANILITAAAACGFLEIWEYETIQPYLHINENEINLSQDQLNLKSEYIKRAVEWSSGMVKGTFKEIIELYTGFEPLVSGYIDDRIRISIVLPLGKLAGQISDLNSKISGITNDVLNIDSQNQIRGLNSGYALGKLILVDTASEVVNFETDKIYVLAQPPADLKPVAGLLTVSEGNLVSHVQLLARNLGIPNSVITQSVFDDLKDFSGMSVFYAVSLKGSVIIKLSENMNETEKNLFKKITVREDKFRVPTNKINLEMDKLINLRKLRADDSGYITGPKAANLGELKYYFPDNVVEGFAIPFGVYKKHLDQKIPDIDYSYWDFINTIFDRADSMHNNGKDEKSIEEFILAKLSDLRSAIQQMPLLPGFQSSIRRAFIEIFGTEMGQIPVFIRSDTNMEDLKDFTGAGLNLTVFNVRDPQKIWQGIRDVWASPFSERSYRWRQRLLLNPENVYPSILIIPSVNNDKSGVLITTGIYSGDSKDLTVAFNRGSGGAVEGQVAESYTIKNDSIAYLLSPCRELRYTILPEEGGIEKPIASLDQPILDQTDLSHIYQFANIIKSKFKIKKGFESSGALDIELGIKDGKIWLFQVRPFVESKKAKSTEYLNHLDQSIMIEENISLDKHINQLR